MTVTSIAIRIRILRLINILLRDGIVAVILRDRNANSTVPHVITQAIMQRIVTRATNHTIMILLILFKMSNILSVRAVVLT